MAVLMELMNQTVRNEKTGCWEWQGRRDPHGYGHFWSLGKNRLAHRVMMSLVHGHPLDLWILHQCDNPPCINPEHLSVGNMRDNTLDRDVRNRQVSPLGHERKSSVLTPHLVSDARTRHQGGTSIKDLSMEYGVSYQVLKLAVDRQTWTHVGDDGSITRNKSLPPISKEKRDDVIRLWHLGIPNEEIHRTTGVVVSTIKNVQKAFRKKYGWRQ